MWDLAWLKSRLKKPLEHKVGSGKLGIEDNCINTFVLAWAELVSHGIKVNPKIQIPLLAKRKINFIFHPAIRDQ